MEKTKLGISVGLAGAIMYFGSLFGGYIVAFVLAGYWLMCEEDAWLRRTAVKAVMLLVLFSLAGAVVQLIPNLISLFNQFLNVFDGQFHNAFTIFVNNTLSFLYTALSLAQKVLFCVLGVMALTKRDVKFPILDAWLERHMA